MYEVEIIPGVFVRQIAAPDVVLRVRSGDEERDVVLADLLHRLGISPEEVSQNRRDLAVLLGDIWLGQARYVAG